MNLFRKAKIVTLCSKNGKFLLANDDKKLVNQGRNRSLENALWTVELVPSSLNKIRFTSYHNLYLTAFNLPWLPSGKVLNALQTPSKILNDSIEWEVIEEGTQVKLKNVQNNNFLKVNRGQKIRAFRKFMKQDPNDPEDELWDVTIIKVIKIEDLHRAALFHYDHASLEVKQKADKFFNSIDKDKNGEISFEEFIEYLEKSNPPIDRKFFADLDRNEDGCLQFVEVLTLQYMLITQAEPQQPDAQNPRGKKQDAALLALVKGLSFAATVIGLSTSCVDLFERI